MNVLENKVENQVHFWSLLGPFLILSSITVLLFKLSTYWYFPLCALIGIPLCIKWKAQGMVAALSLLFCMSILSYQQLALEDRYWHVGMSLAIAFSFIIFTLSLEESQEVIRTLQVESQSRLENCLRLDEKLTDLENTWMHERENLQAQIQTLTRASTKNQDDKQTFYKLAQLSKDELVQIRLQHEQLLQDILYKKQQMAQLNERLEETELTLQEMVNSDAQKKMQSLQQDIATIEQQKETLQAQLHLQCAEKEQFKIKSQESVEREQVLLFEKEHLENQVSTYEKEIEKLSQDMQLLQLDRQKISEQTYQEMEKRYADVQTQQIEYRNKISDLEKQTQKLHQQIESKTQLIEQKNHQFEQSEQDKEQLLDMHKQVQKQLTETQKELASLQRYQQNLPYAKGNTRQIEVMYVQLREQFKEKSLQLDSTRKELFAIQEELSQVKRRHEEAQLFEETFIDKAVAHLFKDIEKENQHTEKEIEQLHALVDMLMALPLR